MSFEKPENLSAEEMEKIDESRKTYEKDAGKLARKKTSIYERVTGTGVTKEEIIHSDAKLENATRATSAKKYVGIDRIIGGKENFERLQNSNLEIENIGNDEKVLSGVIDGQEIKIIFKDMPVYGGYEKIEGYINGEAMDKSDAIKICDKYSPLARARMERIDRIKEDKEERREKEIYEIV
jgi:hypothetical protein